MKKAILPLSLLLLFVISSCKQDNKEEPTTKELTQEVEENKELVNDKLGHKKELTIQLEPKNGSNVKGSVKFIQDKFNYVKMIANLEGLTPGTHAFHIHESADCSSDDGKSAGGHWNPTAQPHGEWGNKNGYHKGDIGNFVADQEGKGLVTMNTNEWCIGCGDETKDILNKAIIVHEGFDDLTSQPSGAAGKRVSCAGIIQ